MTSHAKLVAKVEALEKAQARAVRRLTKAIEFHRTNENDPHRIGTAVMCALIEVRTALDQGSEVGRE